MQRKYHHTFSSPLANVLLFLAAFERCLRAAGDVPSGTDARLGALTALD